MTKSKPYPCTKGKYKSKDGLHIVFPKIVLKRMFIKYFVKRFKKIMKDYLNYFKTIVKIHHPI